MLPVPFEYVANGHYVTLQRCAVLPNVAATWIRWSSTNATWERIDTTLQRGSGHAYGQAFQLLQDLAEAYACVQNDAAFRRGLVRLMAKHGNRGAWVKRLVNGGFMWTPKT